MRRLSKLIGLVVALLVLVPNVAFVSAQGDMAAKNGDLLDLAAMALTPTDLDEAGFKDFLIADGLTQSLEDRVIGQTQSGDNAESIRSFLTGLGWLRGYRSRLAHPIDAGTEDFDALISSGVTQFKDEAGAHSGWSLISGLDVQSGQATPIADAETIGDESALIDVGSQAFDGGEQHPGMRFVFRSGVLVGDIIVFGTPGESLDPTDIEALATRQLERMTEVADSGGPGLSLLALRWRGTGLSDPDVDNYVKFDGEAFGGLGDSEQDIAQSAANFADAINHYRYEAQLSPKLFQYTSIASFPDKAAATDWIKGAFDRTEQNRPEGSTLEKVTNAPSFGDSSVVLKVTAPMEDGSLTGYAVFAQIGTTGVSLALISLDNLTLDHIIEMAGAQFDCFDAGDCAESVPLPEWVNA